MSNHHFLINLGECSDYCGVRKQIFDLATLLDLGWPEMDWRSVKIVRGRRQGVSKMYIAMDNDDEALLASELLSDSGYFFVKWSSGTEYDCQMLERLA